MYWYYLAIVLGCFECVYAWTCECKHDGDGVYACFVSDRTLLTVLTDREHACKRANSQGKKLKLAKQIMLMYWDYLVTVLGCFECVYACVFECKHDGNGVCIFFWSDRTPTVL